jgi:hypothetical protein
MERTPADGFKMPLQLPRSSIADFCNKIGTKRIFAALHQFVRYWTREADIGLPLLTNVDLRVHDLATAP